jgi:SAM-dependent methyltransferase
MAPPFDFSQLVWREDRVLLGDLVFRLEQASRSESDTAEESFVLYKLKPLVDQYARFWAARRDFDASNVLELGLWDGGSMALWNILLAPRRHVGVDLYRRHENAYFERWRKRRNAERVVRAYGGVDQSDAHALRRMVSGDLEGRLDLVIDDASHQYEPTRASFTTLFPFLRPGGLYLIEDWAWGHWQEFQSPAHPWAGRVPPTRLVEELVAAVGTSEQVVAGLTVQQGFVAVERGPAVLAREQPLDLGAIALQSRT